MKVPLSCKFSFNLGDVFFRLLVIQVICPLALEHFVGISWLILFGFTFFFFVNDCGLEPVLVASIKEKVSLLAVAMPYMFMYRQYN
jgi:hypothetical protein